MSVADVALGLHFDASGRMRSIGPGAVRERLRSGSILVVPATRLDPGIHNWYPRRSEVVFVASRD